MTTATAQKVTSSRHAVNVLQLTNPGHITTDEIVAQLRQRDYTWVEHRITQEHFPMREWKCDGSIRLRLIGYKEPMTSQRVLADARRRGLKERPLYEHGLIAALQRPQGRGLIVFLIKPWEDNPSGDSVVMAIENGSRLALDLVWWKNRIWPQGTRFGFPEPNGCKKKKQK